MTDRTVTVDRNAPVARDDIPEHGRIHRRAPFSARFLLTRLAVAVVTIWALVTFVFLMLIATGDPTRLLIDPESSPEEAARVAAEMGLDRPWYEQYVSLLQQILTGSFPDSLRYRSNAFGLVMERVPASIALGLSGLLVGVTVAAVIGYVAARDRPRRIGTGQGGIIVANVVEAVPTFFLGVILILIFGVKLKVLPIAGVESLSAFVLPSIVLAVTIAAPASRVFRTAILETRTQGHPTAARARGVPRFLVELRHVIANSLGPVLNVIAVRAGMVFGGAVVVETMFRWPGVGQLAVTSIGGRDYPLVIATVIVLGTGCVLITLIADILAGLFDPKVRS
jgi:ABC-type dipeptide/oligopeptide/nickel transport system permease component